MRLYDALLKTTKRMHSSPTFLRAALCSLTICLLHSGTLAYGKLVDNFDDNTKTDWKDDGFGVGKSTEVNGQLKFEITASGSSVIINGKVLDKDNNNAVLFDKTFIDTSAADVFSDGKDDPAAAYTGPGHFVLMEYEDFDPAGPAVYEVIFDNAAAFVLD